MSVMKLLTATSVAALMLTGSAFAQDRMPPAGGNSGAVQKSEPAPSAPASVDKGAADKAAPKGSVSEAPAKAPAQNAQAPAKADPSKAGDAKMSNDTKAGDTKAGANSQLTNNSKTGQKAGTDSKMSNDAKSGDTKTNAAGTPNTKSTVGSTSASGSLTTEQKTEIRSTVLTANAPRVTNVNFSINVGTVVPSSVRIVEVPAPLIRIHPEWRGHRYFVVNDQIIIVEAGTMRIIAVLDV